MKKESDMSNELAIIEDEEIDFGDYQDLYNVSRVSAEKYEMGLKFADYLVQYRDKSKAYNKVYGYHERAANLSTQLINTRWMTMILDRMMESQYALFFDKRLEMLDEAYVTGKSDNGRTKVDAMKLFLEHTKKPDAIKVDVEVKDDSSVELVGRIDSILKTLSSNGQLYQNDGTITDVDVILD